MGADGGGEGGRVVGACCGGGGGESHLLGYGHGGCMAVAERGREEVEG